MHIKIYLPLIDSRCCLASFSTPTEGEIGNHELIRLAQSGKILGNFDKEKFKRFLNIFIKLNKFYNK